MNEPWVIVIIAIVSLLLGAPVMSAVGTWVQARFGLLATKVEEETDLAKQARDQEYADIIAHRQRQSREMENLRAKVITYEDALRDTVRRCDELERKQVVVEEQLARQTTELETLRVSDVQKSAEIIQHQNRIRSLESELYRTQQELSVERAARMRLEGNAG